MKITIENYRGIEIYFDTDNEKFQCVITEDSTKESQSFSSIKKYIDDYKKENQSFKPFYVVASPTVYGYVKNKKLKVIGQRKDGKFIYENEKGEKGSVSIHDEKDYVLEFQENEEFFKELNDLNEKIEKQRIEDNAKEKEIISKMNLTTLADFKKTI